MRKTGLVCRVLLAGILVAGAGMAGCTKKPNQQEISKLEDARAAAESAERKLAELRQERKKLEDELKGKQSELDMQQKELDSLKSKTGR